MIPTWFLHLQGFAMVIMGVSLIAMRPRAKSDSFYVKYVNVGTLWALLCIAVGIGLLSMALGYVQWPNPAPPAAPRRHLR